MAYDLILANGRYVADVVGREPPTEWHGSSVVHARRLYPWHGLPVLGMMLRNFWAKKHGAVFDPTWFP